MGKYRKKPIVIDAVRYDERYPLQVLDFVGTKASWSRRTNTLRISTLEGEMIAQPGDWIIRGVKGEFYPCKPDIFDATYEKEIAP
jgi:hypothetical protein